MSPDKLARLFDFLLVPTFWGKCKMKTKLALSALLAALALTACGGKPAEAPAEAAPAEAAPAEAAPAEAAPAEAAPADAAAAPADAAAAPAAEPAQ